MRDTVTVSNVTAQQALVADSLWRGSAAAIGQKS